MHPAIETVGLVKRFPKQPGWRNLLRKKGEKLVLDQVDLAVHPGEIFGLLGPNGAGKTTLAKILCTLITPTAGAVRVAGLDVMREQKAVSRRIGLVYGDQRSFFWRLSLLENLRFYAALYQLPREVAERRIAELLDLVGLREAGGTRMHYFSSGMKQRAAIARGLLSDPEIILLDEPTTAVDPLAAHQVRGMIRNLIAQDGRRTVLLLTNVMDEAELLCDRIALLNQGHIELVGTVAAFRRQFQPHEQYSLAISTAPDNIAHRLAAIPGVNEVVPRVLDADRMELGIAVQRGSAAIPEVIRCLVQASINVWGCERKELSLDEMFRLTFGRDSDLATAMPEAALASVGSGG